MKHEFTVVKTFAADIDGQLRNVDQIVHNAKDQHFAYIVKDNKDSSKDMYYTSAAFWSKNPYIIGIKSNVDNSYVEVDEDGNTRDNETGAFTKG